MSNKKDTYFSYKQLKAINLLALGDMSQVDISVEVGVNPNSITRWKKDPAFMHAVVMQSRKLLKEDLPAVYKSLTNESKDGSAQHIKILLDHLESLDNANNNTATLTFTWKEDQGESNEAE